MRREELLNDTDEDRRLGDESLLSRIWTALPCLVQSVDYQKFTISAQPTIQGKIEDEEGNVQDVNLPLLVDIPIVFPRAGKWAMTSPVVPGDECLVIFSSRCIDAWWQNGGVQKALETRKLDLSDGIAIFGPYSQPHAQKHVGGFSSNSVILRDNEKKNYLEYTDDGKVNVLHQSDLDWDTLGNADVYIKGNAVVKIDGNVDLTIKGNTTAMIDGTLDATVKQNVTLTAEADVAATVKGNTTAVMEGTLDATVKQDVNLTAGANVTTSITGNLDCTVTGNITAKAAQLDFTANNITINCPNTTFNGAVKATDTITSDADCIGGGISLKGHVHGGVQGGTSTTGGPQ